jgi:hypothetical protein
MTAVAPRVFLVVVDETEEMGNALRYACRRAQRTGGHVALLQVIEPTEFQDWLGVGRMLESEARSEAELRLQTFASNVLAQTGNLPVLYIREGNRAEQLVALLQEDPSISTLVLATASDGNNPGPLVSFLLSHLGRRVKVPVTLVPGELTQAEIDALT